MIVSDWVTESWFADITDVTLVSDDSFADEEDEEDGKDGKDGKDGNDGKDGKDGDEDDKSFQMFPMDKKAIYWQKYPTVEMYNILLSRNTLWGPHIVRVQRHR